MKFNGTIFLTALASAFAASIISPSTLLADANAGHEYVDLGLPSGTLWATCNLGATSPEQYGDFYAWGETTGYSSLDRTFDWTTYTLCSGTATSLTKYCTDSSYGTVDNQTTLDLSDDAANQIWGGAWHIPTDAQLTELRENTTLTNETINGIAGRRLTSKLNGNSIFMPFTGYFENAEYKNEGVYGNYWSASTNGKNQAYAIWFPNSGAIRRGLIDRCYAQAIRPVCSDKYLAIGKCGDNLTYTIDQDSVMTISGTGAMYDYQRYSYEEDQMVINNPWSYIKSLKLEEGITIIGEEAFLECSYLHEVEFPSTLTDIKFQAFAYSGLTSLTIPNTVKEIFYEAFYYCENLKEVIIEDGNNIMFEPSDKGEDGNIGVFGACPIEYVYLGRDIVMDREFHSYNEFYDNSYPPFAMIPTLKKVDIGELVTELPNCCFYGCPIQNLTIGENIKLIGYYAINACNSSQPLVIPSSVSVLGCGLNPNVAYLVLEDGGDLDLTNYINDYCRIQLFEYEDCDSIYLGRNLIADADVFEASHFRSACIGTDISLRVKSYISDDEYYNDDEGYETNEIPVYYTPYLIDATNLYFTDGSSVGNEVFKSSSTIENVYNLGYVGDNAFSYCDKLKKVVFSDNVSSIGNNAFQGCTALTELTIPSGIIGEYSFADCSNLKKVTFGDAVTDIKSFAFYECTSLQEVIIPESVTHIGVGAFDGTPWYQEYRQDSSHYYGPILYINQIAYDVNDYEITSCEFRDGTLVIGDEVMSGNDVLTTVTIPESVQYVGTYAFSGCSNLSSVYVGHTPPVVGDYGAFDSRILSTCVLYVPEGCKSVYENDDFWRSFKHIVEYGLDPDTDISALDNAIYVNQTSGRIGGSKNISVRLKNTCDVTGFQFAMELAEGITINSFAVSEERLATGVTPNDVIQTIKVTDNKITVACPHRSGSTIFSGNDGEIATINVSIPDTMELGSYPILLTACDISNTSNQDEDLPDVKATLILEDYLVGDANNDGKIRIGDATSILNYIVGIENEGFNAKAADANEDGKIRIGDVTYILNIIVSQ